MIWIIMGYIWNRIWEWNFFLSWVWVWKLAEGLFMGGLVDCGLFMNCLRILVELFWSIGKHK